jgi:hypothetical protein
MSAPPPLVFRNRILLRYVFWYEDVLEEDEPLKSFLTVPREHVTENAQPGIGVRARLGVVDRVYDQVGKVDVSVQQMARRARGGKLKLHRANYATFTYLVI